MIESDINPHKGDRTTLITLNYTVDPSITSDTRLKIYLNNYDEFNNKFDYSVDDTIIDYFEINPFNTSPITFRLDGKNSWFYRVCVKLAHNGSYYTDCDGGNQFLLLDDTPINIQVYQEVKPSDLKLTASIPSLVFSGDDLLINVTVTNDGFDEEVKIYSYALNGSKKISEGAWDSNAQFFNFSLGNSISTTLRNLINDSGEFIVKVKANDLVVSGVVKVMDKPFRKIYLTNSSTRLTVINQGSINETVLLMILYPNDSKIFNFVLPSKRYKEFLVNYSDDCLIHFLMFVNNSLATHGSVKVNASRVINKTIDNMNQTIIFPNEVNLSLSTVPLNVVNSSPLTGYHSAVFDTEILLYPSIVFFSLTSLFLVLKRL